MSADIDAAVAIMAEATSHFVQDPYATEALEALITAGWTLTPPTDSVVGRIRERIEAIPSDVWEDAQAGTFMDPTPLWEALDDIDALVIHDALRATVTWAAARPSERDADNPHLRGECCCPCHGES